MGENLIRCDDVYVFRLFGFLFLHVNTTARFFFFCGWGGGGAYLRSGGGGGG